MAETPPESVIVGQFVGLKNAVAKERLKPEELAAALNVDIDNAGQVRRRAGYVQRAVGDFHSLYTSPEGITFAVRDGWLGRVMDDFTHQPLTPGGSAPVSYVSVGGTVYFSSEAVSGKITPETQAEPWGQDGGAGEWVSPVVNPTATLGEVGGALLGPPPLAQHLTAINGRIYLAEGNVLWATELYMYDYVDRTRSFMQFESRITGLGYSGDGIYVGTETGVWFLRGALGSMERRMVVKSRHVAGSMVEVEGDLALVAGEPAMQYRNAVMFMTEDGLIAGFNGGFCRNLTANEQIFPEAEVAVPLVRMHEGIHQYVAVTNTGGTPVARARIGDYAEAEIRRRQT